MAISTGLGFKFRKGRSSRFRATVIARFPLYTKFEFVTHEPLSLLQGPKQRRRSVRANSRTTRPRSRCLDASRAYHNRRDVVAHGHGDACLRILCQPLRRRPGGRIGRNAN